MIECLLTWPVARTGDAPSVLVDNVAPGNGGGDVTVIEDATAKGIVTTRDLGEDFSQWINETIEGMIKTAAIGLRLGHYTLNVRINSASGELCSESRQAVEALAGPFFERPALSGLVPANWW